MPILEYAAQSFPQRHTIFKYAADLCLAKIGKADTGFTLLPMTSCFDNQISYLYANKKDLNI